MVGTFQYYVYINIYHQELGVLSTSMLTHKHACTLYYT